MDMMDLQFEDTVFDTVIDKATMDVVMTDNEDPWNPSDAVIERAAKLLRNSYRVLKPSTGAFIQISFDQPHFRKKFLLNEEFKWTLTQRSIDHGLGYFMYILKKD